MGKWHCSGCATAICSAELLVYCCLLTQPSSSCIQAMMFEEADAFITIPGTN